MIQFAFKARFVVLLLGSAVFSIGAHAEDKGLGCGLGSMIAPHKTWVSATTQGAIDYVLPPSFSITSGTMGCAKHSIVSKEKEAVYYAEANYDRLEAEVPTGRGEYVTGFASVLGCREDSQAEIVGALKLNYERLFPANGRDADRMLRNVQELIRTEPKLRDLCSANFII